MLPALALAALIVTSLAQAQKPGKIKIEAETGELVGTLVMADGVGYSGTGYVGRFEAQNSAVRLHCTAHKGIYEAHIHYRSQSVKGFDLVVNGKKSSAIFAPSGNLFADSNAGKIELKEGANDISIERGWGYYQIDFIEQIPAGEVKPLLTLTDHLADGKASPKARQLMRTLLKTYGKQTLSGQQNGSDVAYIQTTTGLSPAIISCDLIDYSPSRVEHGTRPGGTTESMIKEYRSGSVISVMWHWNAPKDLIDVKNYKTRDGKTIDASWYRGFYTDSTTFDLAKALSDKNSADYKLLIRDIDVIALELKKLQAADIPVLWRPLHEAEGGWFWWGAKGPEAFKSLWERSMID